MNLGMALLALVVGFMAGANGVVGAYDACRVPRHIGWQDVDHALRREARVVRPRRPPNRRCLPRAKRGARDQRGDNPRNQDGLVRRAKGLGDEGDKHTEDHDIDGCDKIGCASQKAAETHS